MLCQFTFENFKSFKNEAFLDFFAEPISDNTNSLIIDEDNERFLPVVSIYGPNGGGKSTVLEALRFLMQTLAKPIIASNINDEITLEELSILNKSINEIHQEKFYKFDSACEYQPIVFDILFRTNGIQYKYELSILKNLILKENLYYNKIGEKDAVLVFERTDKDCIVGEDIQSISVKKIKSSLPLFSHIAASYDIEVIDNAMSWFLKINFVDYDNPNKDKQILLPKKEEDRILFFEMLRQMDINVFDIRVEEDIDGNVKNLYTKHVIQGKDIELPFQEESSGTRKIFSCLARINDCLLDGKLLVADELDAKLHPKLLRFIIELFTNPERNKHGAQLLITSHDIVNMNPEVFRRDEIWFCALSQNNTSNLYSLISFKEENGKQPRKDAVYGKRYLEGKYGADPYIRKGLDWESEI